MKQWEAPAPGTRRATYFAVTELLMGETLSARLSREHLSWRRAVEIGAAVADGLALVAVGAALLRPSLVQSKPLVTPTDTLLLADIVNRTGDAVFAVLRPRTAQPGARLRAVGGCCPRPRVLRPLPG